MKLLHSKSTAEPVLAVSACPCANLFGLVTHRAVNVYRSTTLTTVFAFPLKSLCLSDETERDGRSDAGTPAQRADYCCCWSPSGRLFTLALPSGLLLIFDVEGGALARVFTTAPGRSTTAISSPAPPAAAVPWVPTSLPHQQPVLALSWCSVPSLNAAQLRAMATEVQTRCLPVRTGVTAALFDEATQSGSSSGTCGDAATVCDAAFSPTNNLMADRGELFLLEKEAKREVSNGISVSLLLVLGCDGVLRCLVAGLYEVHAVSMQLPSTLAKAGVTWQQLRVHEMQVRQRAVGIGSTGKRSTGNGDGVSRSTAVPTCFGWSAMDPVRPAVAQHHELFLTVSVSPSTAPLHVHHPRAQALWEVPLSEALTTLAAPQWLAFCAVQEHVRLAHEAFERVAQRWHAVLHGRVLAHLGLPEAAALVSDAMMAQLTEPDPIRLYRYATQQLTRAALADDLEAMSKTFHALSYEVTQVCDRCIEVAMAYAVHTAGWPHDSNVERVIPFSSKVPTSLVERLGSLRRHHERFVQQAASDAECARDLSLWVLQQAVQWERGPRFDTRDAAHEYGGDEEQTGAATVATFSAGEERRTGSPMSGERGSSPPPQPPPAPSLPSQPVLVEETPISATRQPALLRYLTGMLDAAPASPATVGRKGPHRPEINRDSSSDATPLYNAFSAFANQRMRCLAHAFDSSQLPPSNGASDVTCGVVFDVATGEGAPASASTVAAPPPLQLLRCVVQGALTDTESNGGDAESSEHSDDDDEVLDFGGGAAEGKKFDAMDDFYRLSTNAAAVSTQTAHLHAVQLSVLPPNASSSASSAPRKVQPLHLSSFTLHPKGEEEDDAEKEEMGEEEGTTREAVVNTSAAAPSNVDALEESSTADVDTAALESRLKADVAGSSTGNFIITCYDFLEEDRHVLVCQPASVLSRGHFLNTAASGRLNANAAAPFFVAVVQDDGELVIADERGEDEDGESSNESENAVDRNSADEETNASASRAALCQVTGIEDVPLRMSVSRARSFCVIVGVTRYVVLSLYDDEY